MANKDQLKILEQGVKVWNEWTKDNMPEKIDLRGAYLSQTHLTRAYLKGADLIGADLSLAHLSQAVLDGASLWGANLIGADLKGTNLRSADLRNANLNGADLRGADLRGAYLDNAILVGTYIEQANLKDCRIYGLSAWDLKGTPQDQTNLIITRPYEPIISVDDIQVAQFIYLLLNNKNVRNVLDTITAKAVLILGRFTDERKAVLDAISNALRERNYLPILFDFEGSKSRDIHETVSTLAHMAKFIIADITDAKSIPHELQAIVPNLPSVPIQPLLLSSQSEYAMFNHFKRYPWVLEIYMYNDTDSLIDSIQESVIQPAETWLANKL